MKKNTFKSLIYFSLLIVIPGLFYKYNQENYTPDSFTISPAEKNYQHAAPGQNQENFSLNNFKSNFSSTNNFTSDDVAEVPSTNNLNEENSIFNIQIDLSSSMDFISYETGSVVSENTVSTTQENPSLAFIPSYGNTYLLKPNEKSKKNSSQTNQQIARISPFEASSFGLNSDAVTGAGPLPPSTPVPLDSEYIVVLLIGGFMGLYSICKNEIRKIILEES